jgi:transposase InsO family protein
MPWKQVEMSEERIRFGIEASKPDACVAQLCRQFGISRPTGYLWLKRYQEGGARAVMTELSRRPRSSPKKVPEVVTEALKKARLQRPDWGARKLWLMLRKGDPKLPDCSKSTLQRILDREGLVSAGDRQQMALQRFERERPNELWQMDFKGPQGFNKSIGPLSILDDFSRYLLALQHVSTNNTANVKTTLQATFEQCGLPEHMLLDHGKPWYDSVNLWGWTELTVWILRQGVRLCFSGVRHPQTQGKIERMHGALQRAVRKRKPDVEQQQWLDEFRDEYNRVRPHEGIGMTTPATRWVPSPRKFNPNPGDWAYPKDWPVVKLAGQGQLNYKGRRWEVSGALRGQEVGLEFVGSRMLVHFCRMPVREIDLATGTNQALPGNPFRSLAGPQEGE